MERGGRWRGHWRRSAAALALCLAPIAFAGPVEDALRIAGDVNAPVASRLVAALDLIRNTENVGARDAIDTLLQGPVGNGSGGGVVLRALASGSDAPPRVYPLLARRIAGAEPDELPRLLAALSSFRTRDAARLLILHATPDTAPPVSSAAFAGLTRLSGRDDLGADYGRWLAWMDEVDGWSESRWRAALVSAQARRADAAVAERDALTLRLVGSLRALHLATPAEERSALLAGMMTDAIGPVCDAGFELVAREISASAELGPEVADAAVGLMASPDPRTRVRAAGVVRQLAPAHAPDAVVAALARETDPGAAAALLLAAARWPTPGCVEPALAWLSAPGPARTEASEAVWRLYLAGELGLEAQAAALAACRAAPDADLTPAMCSLLATIGGEADRERLRPLLVAPDAALRAATAEALLWYPEHTDEIVMAAAADVDLFDAASRAVLVNDPTANGLETLLRLPRPSPDVTQPALARLVRQMPATEVWAVARRANEPALLGMLLRSLTADEREMAEAANPEARAAIGEGVVALANLQLDANEAESALVTIESSPFVGRDVGPPMYAGPPGLAELRCAAIVALGRVELAEPMEVGPDPWLRGLAIARRQPFAARVLAVLEAKFGAALTDEQRRRLEAIRGEIASVDDGTSPELR